MLADAVELRDAYTADHANEVADLAVAVGKQIPRGAMVIATCDAYHAMTSDRSYRRAMPKQAAIRELEASAGTQFDASVVAALIAEVV